MSHHCNITSTTPCVWYVEMQQRGAYSLVILTHRLRFPDGCMPQFDEQDICPPDAEVGDDDRMMMEAFLALIPSTMNVSCAIRAIKQRLFIFGQMYYQRVFAGYDKQIIADSFDGGLHNPEHSADFLFVGGSAAMHTPERITHWAERTQHMLDQHDQKSWVGTIELLLDRYDRILCVLDTHIYIFVRSGSTIVADIRSTLSTVAARYGLVLPEDKFPIEWSADDDRANTS